MKKIIYQAFTRLWGNGTMAAWDCVTLDYLRSMGVDYVWYTGIPRHASGQPFVKGNPGCPYSVSDWMDVNPYLAEKPELRMAEFSALVKRTHDAGLKVLMDYVPNHVARDYAGEIEHFDYCDGDWTDTFKVNWDSPRTFDAMRRILTYWASLGVDGFRCDMVELVPADKLRSLISLVKSEYPELLFVAEVYQKDNYRRYLDCGFDLLYDKSGLYDALMDICCHGHTARRITWNWQFLGDMQPRMLNFLENHDEVRLASPSFLCCPEKAYAAVAVSLLFNDAPFMLYFGQEAGEDAAESDNGRTSIFNWSRPAMVNGLYSYIHGEEGLDERHLAVLSRYAELLGYSRLGPFVSGRCWDLCYCNEGSPGFNADRHFAFLRYDETSAYLVVSNFSDGHSSMEIRLPSELAEYAPTSSPVECSVAPWEAEIIRLR